MFWDASAISALLIRTKWTEELITLAAEDAERIVWWATKSESTALICRLERERQTESYDTTELLIGLRKLIQQSIEIQPTSIIRERADRLLRIHPLSATDALQLAAALTFFDEQPAEQTFVSLQQNLRSAATLEGFFLLPQISPLV